MGKGTELVVVADTLDGGAVLTMFDATDGNNWRSLGQMAETVSSKPDEILEAYGWERIGEWFDDGDDFTASVKRTRRNG